MLQFFSSDLNFSSPTYNSTKLKTTYLVDIVHTFIFNKLFYNQSNLNLSSSILREKYGTHYNYYIEYLLQLDVISKVSNYIVGEKCKTFTLNKQYYNNIIRVQNFDKVLIRKNLIQKNKFLESNKININTEIQNLLQEDLLKVSIDYDAAIAFLKTINCSKEAFLKNEMSCLYIRDKNIFSSWDKFGRFHTNFTTLKKEIRNQYLQINNNPICELDIPNSQPLFLIQLITNTVDSKELIKFKHLVYKGYLYDYLIGHYKTKVNKKQMKNILFSVFYGKNESHCRFSRFFKSVFPSIYEYIRAVKTEHNDYTILAKKLQQLESEFIFNTVVLNIKTTYPHISIFTVHDSICFESRYLSEASLIFNAELTKLYQLQ